MNKEHFLQAIENFESGLIEFNEGNQIISFLYKGKWFPAHAFCKLLYNNPKINSQDSVHRLTTNFPYLRIKRDVNFVGSNCLPVPLTPEEKLAEIKLVTGWIDQLSIV